ncbi:peptidase U61 LD-carboxypeptidase A [Clostridium sp. CAG:245]|nr:peptidase U61 LD-carboxypeptidase A [Clostridium sp. CAG:245]
MIPTKLKKGDTIGVIAPSNYIEKDDLEYINASIALMEASGFKVKFGKYVFEDTLGYGTSPEKRAADLNWAFKDDEVKAIMCVKGGEDSNTTLDYIDYEMIKKHPKIICGFSDNTSILNAIHEKTGLVTYHGPTFKSLTSWETGYAYKQFIKTFAENTESLIMGEPEDEYTTIQAGQATGELVGGNLSLFTKLVCGKYAVNLQDKILFLEELGFEAAPEMVNSNIYYLKQNGVFDRIAGLWIGNYEHPSKVSIEKIIKNAIGDEYKFPIIKSDNFGHIDKKIIIPIGTKAEINTNEKIKIKLVEKCVDEGK